MTLDEANKILEEAKSNSISKYNHLKKLVKDAYRNSDNEYDNVVVFVCGSLAREEMVKTSDLDLFFIDMNIDENNCENNHDSIVSMEERYIDKYNFFSKLYRINREMGFSKPSKNGRFWRFISAKNLKDIGSQQEDYNNSFTARLLMLLEGKPLFNGEKYSCLVRSVVDKYFIDYEEHKTEFYPVYLLNDILRYWYTLTLNYEYRRDDKDDDDEKNWKRLKLKFARLLTCFSFIACLCQDGITKEKVENIINMTPIQRLKYLKEKFRDVEVPNKENLFDVEIKLFSEIIDNIFIEYACFIKLHDEAQTKWSDKDIKAEVFYHADRFHNFLIHGLIGSLLENNNNLRKRIELM